MKKIKCYSVRLAELISISPKAYRAIAFDGSSAIIPKSMVFGDDYSIKKSNAYWIAAFILERSSLQHSCKKVAWFNEFGRMIPNYIKNTYSPDIMIKVNNNIIEDLKRK